MTFVVVRRQACPGDRNSGHDMVLGGNALHHSQRTLPFVQCLQVAVVHHGFWSSRFFSQHLCTKQNVHTIFMRNFDTLSALVTINKNMMKNTFITFLLIIITLQFFLSYAGWSGG
jgi:hypothetical protein